MTSIITEVIIGILFLLFLLMEAYIICFYNQLERVDSSGKMNFYLKQPPCDFWKLMSETGISYTNILVAILIFVAVGNIPVTA